MPVPVFVTEHPRGRVLFDSGMPRELPRDPVTRLGAAAIDIADVRYVVNSHLHFDYASGNVAARNATVVV